MRDVIQCYVSFAVPLLVRLSLYYISNPDDLIKAVSRVDWRPSQVGIDICHRILTSAEAACFTGSTAGTPIAIDNKAIVGRRDWRGEGRCRTYPCPAP